MPAAFQERIEDFTREHVEVTTPEHLSRSAAQADPPR
jgi:hypothetical protein